MTTTPTPRQIAYAREEAASLDAARTLVAAYLSEHSEEAASLDAARTLVAAWLMS